ncbi:MAG: hypothetical protein LC753_17415 [Acidobacteria bacterium]|nr:hypothetical protein [Acidobacteriota bacterium]MCA1651964.1 hypothetical protein [Acidobacteriota bacterium]
MNVSRRTTGLIPRFEQRVVTLDRLTARSADIDGVWADDVRPGDWVIVRTRNSVYSLLANGDGTYDAAGGWFAREHQSGAGLRVAGCTWGGAALLTRMIAAPGMFLEFGNTVRTTRIREVRLIRSAPQPQLH